MATRQTALSRHLREIHGVEFEARETAPGRYRAAAKVDHPVARMVIAWLGVCWLIIMALPALGVTLGSFYLIWRWITGQYS